MKDYNYDVIIIGAGIGGLTTGNILAKNGMKVLILEKNHVPGGAVTTFYRNNYPIDISHSLCALRTGAIIRKMFDYLEITKKLEIVELEKAFIYITGENKSVFCYADTDKYIEELKRHFPSEIEKIKIFFKKTEKIWDKELLKILRSYRSPSLPRLLLYPFLFPNVFKYINYTFDKYLDEFRLSPFLKEVLSAGWPYLGLNKDKASALYMICLIGSFHKDRSYFIKGGFGNITRLLESNFKKLGGKILYNTEIKEILFNNRNMAYAVRDKNSNMHQAKKIISNIDSKKTFLELIEKNRLSQSFYKRIQNFTMSYSMIQVHIVAEAEVSKEYLSCGTIMLSFKSDLEQGLKRALNIFNKENANQDQTAIVGINYLKDFLPQTENNTFVFNIGVLSVNYALWKSFFNSFGEKEYENIKNEISQLIIKELKKIWAIKDVKFTNVLTPLSFEKWLGVTEGAVYDIACSPRQVLFNRLKNKTKINNFYLVGAKTLPGHGIIGALTSAFFLSDLLLGNKLSEGKISLN